MKAEFIGEVDECVGLVKGKTYNLTAIRAPRGPLYRPINIEITEPGWPMTGKEEIKFQPYRSLEDFFANWKFWEGNLS
jgi:hypothetical protein